MDCGRCGLWIECPREGDLFYDGDAIVCSECGATNVITVCDDDPPDVYVQGWTCKHGKDDATPCDECDAEEATAA